MYVEGAESTPEDPVEPHLDDGKCCSSLESPGLMLDTVTRWDIGLISLRDAASRFHANCGKKSVNGYLRGWTGDCSGDSCCLPSSILSLLY